MADARRKSTALHHRTPSIQAVVITCEHGGNRIPAPYRRLFDGQQSLLDSHRGYDPGALGLARKCAAALDAPLYYSTTSRLLVELNRSIGHPSLFSATTKPLPRAERAEILKRYYRPYRDEVEQAIAEGLRKCKTLLHVSVHTFTPVLDGRLRQADIGLLYDPKRVGESALCGAWRDSLKRIAPELRVRSNYPYRGTADGFTTYLRTRFPKSRYLGVEIEVNQRFSLGPSANWLTVQRLMVDTLRQLTVSAG